jgi:DNA polymerase-3 subunit gamma/tau
MKDFIVSARKYRPLTFDAVVGQAVITDTLKNAVKNNHIAQAYLFCGPRGVGKTTCARIFAKTLNCQNLSPEIVPCDECESCIAFRETRSYNIHELDAASNNSVEDIRNLIDQVRIPPQIGKYSVYIIDEVHMLSQQAFNAFLKTLEEPPAHAIFIMATTEKHKIIPTILSRCQIFDFNRIQVNDIEKYLEKISGQESVKYEHDALNIIAQKADGAMRDALSIYDQMLSFARDNLTYQAVIEHLNILDYDYYFKLTNHFFENNITDALLVFNDILNHGFDIRNFISGLSGHFRDLLVAKDKSTHQLMEVGANIKERYVEQSLKCNVSFLLTALEILNKTDMGYNGSINKRLHVELAMIQLSQITAEKKNSTNNPLTGQEQKNNTAASHSRQQPATEKKNEKDQASTGMPKVSEKIKPTHNYQSTPSINLNMGSTIPKVKEGDGMPGKKDEQQVPASKDKLFTEERLQEVWMAFANENKKEKQHLHTVMTSAKPVKEELCVVFPVTHALQESTIEEVRNRLVAYLKEHLENDKIELRIMIKKEDDTQKNQNKLYTPQDKYKYMRNKNPDLDKLREHFNLDFD